MSFSPRMGSVIKYTPGEVVRDIKPSDSALVALGTGG
jgi:hypothetical protein